jgi:hypothetical protein
MKETRDLIHNLIYKQRGLCVKRSKKPLVKESKENRG